MDVVRHPFETGLDRTGANYVPLSPVSFLTGAARAYGNKIAVIDGERRYTYGQLLDRCTRLASALSSLGVDRLDTVAIIASNVPEMIEAHYAAPMLGAVLNPLNTRLDAATIAFSLNHGQAKVLIADSDYMPLVTEALKEIDHPITLIAIGDAGPRASAITKLCCGTAIRISRGPVRTTNGNLSACSIPPARQATPKARSIIIEAPTCRRSATPLCSA